MNKEKIFLLIIGILILIALILFVLPQNNSTRFGRYIIPVDEKLEVNGTEGKTELVVYNVSEEFGETKGRIGIRMNGSLKELQTVKEGDYLEFKELKDKIQVQKVNLSKGIQKSFIEILISIK